MSYYLRFISTEPAETTRSILEEALKQMDPRYSIVESGELKFGDDLYGVIEINRRGDGLFDAEIEELKQFVEDVRGKRKADVLKTLDEAKIIIAVQVLLQERSEAATFQKLDPLLAWLLSHRKGLLQVDDVGYFNQSGRILKVE